MWPSDDTSPIEGTSRRAPVRVECGIRTDDRGETNAVTVELQIQRGFHVYATVGPNDAYLPLEVSVTVTGGYELAGELISPEPRPYRGSGITTYRGRVEFVQPVSGQGPGSANCRVTYQACDPTSCTRPLTTNVTLPIPATSASADAY